MALTSAEIAELKEMRAENAYRAAKTRRRKLDEAELLDWASRNRPQVAEDLTNNYTWRMMMTITEFRYRLLSRRLTNFVMMWTWAISLVYLTLMVLGLNAGHSGNLEYIPYPLIAMFLTLLINIVVHKLNPMP